MLNSTKKIGTARTRPNKAMITAIPAEIGLIKFQNNISPIAPVALPMRSLNFEID